jgi:hypothetical protein
MGGISTTVTPAVDIWSLGCIASELAVWMAFNYEGVSKYYSDRVNDTEQRAEFRDAGCFHNGQNLLQSVPRTHFEVIGGLHTSDRVTPKLLDAVISPMLEADPSVRANAKQVWTWSQAKLREAQDIVDSSGPWAMTDLSLQPVYESEVLEAGKPPIVTEQKLSTSPTSSERKNSKSFLRIFRRPSSSQGQQLPRRASAPGATESIYVPPAQLYKTSSGNMDTQIMSPTKYNNRQSLISHISTSSTLTDSSADTVSDRSRARPVPGAATASNSTAITKYGGSCKYAHYIRDNGSSGGLMRQSVGLGVHHENIVYACKSSKCKFQGKAMRTKSGYQIDDTVRPHEGLQYRWIFLAKSHVSQEPSSKTPSYICLMCTMLNKNSEIYEGHTELFSHIMGHREHVLGDVSLKGPLAFSNGGVKVDVNFDINLLEKPATSPNELPVTFLSELPGNLPCELPDTFISELPA